MKCIRNEICGIGIIAMAAVILLGAAAVTRADGTSGPSLTTFTPGTKISSSQVNDNFSALSNALPGMKWTGGGSFNSSSTDWQTVNQISVTAPADGVFLIFANPQI